MTTIESPLFEQLRIINTVFENSIETNICDESGIAQTLKHLPALKTELAPNQINMVAAMSSYKRRMSKGFQSQNQILFSKVGIVGDPPGTGKTLSVLAYLMPEVQRHLDHISSSELVTNSNRYFFSHTIETADASSVNIVFVPPYLLQQWTREIRTHTRLEPLVIENKRILRNRTTATCMVNSPFLLTTTRLFRDVQEFCADHQIQWNNVFIDEATASHIGSNETLPPIGFLWLITNNWMAFLFKNTYIYPSDLQMVRDRLTLHKDCAQWLNSTIDQNMIIGTHIESSNFVKHIIPWQHSHRGSLILRNSASHCVTYPEITNSMIPCTTTFTLNTIPSIFLKNNYEGLTHELIPTLFRGLSMTQYTMEEIRTYYLEKTALIDRKQHDDCLICLEQPQNSVVLPCCMTFFCGACIFRQLLTLRPQCPTCRSELTLPNLLYVPDVSSAQIEPSMNKVDTCIEYIKSHPNESYLIYSLYENNYYQLYPRLHELGIQCEVIDSCVSRFNKTIANFNVGLTRVLFMSNIDMIRGLTLSKATRLIFFSKCSSFEAQSVLIHSIVRIGRAQEPIHVVKLLSTVE